MIFVALTGILLGSIGGSVVGNGIKVNDENKLRVDFKKGWKESNKYGLMSELFATAALCAISGAGEVVNEAFDDTKKDLEVKKDRTVEKVIENKITKRTDEYVKMSYRLNNGEADFDEQMEIIINEKPIYQRLNKFELIGISTLDEPGICDIISKEEESRKNEYNHRLSYELDNAKSFRELERIDNNYDEIIAFAEANETQSPTKRVF